MSIKYDCDFLELKNKLYKYKNDKFNEYKDSLYQNLSYNTDVSIEGQQ